MSKKDYNTAIKDVLKILNKKTLIDDFFSDVKPPYFYDYCHLCGMSEFEIIDDKNLLSSDKYSKTYHCRCSIWRFEYCDIKWVGWYDKEYAKKMIFEYDYMNFGFNYIIDKIIEKVKKLKIKNK